MPNQDVFISYCHADYTDVLKIINNLRKNNYRVLFDESNSAGDDWLDRARGYISSTKCSIVFLLDNSLKSHPVLEELKIIERQKRFGHYYFAVILGDDKTIDDKYKRLNDEFTERERIIASKIIEYFDERMIYIDGSRKERIFI